MMKAKSVLFSGSHNKQGGSTGHRHRQGMFQVSARVAGREEKELILPNSLMLDLKESHREHEL